MAGPPAEGPGGEAPADGPVKYIKRKEKPQTRVIPRKHTLIAINFVKALAHETTKMITRGIRTFRYYSFVTKQKNVQQRLL